MALKSVNAVQKSLQSLTAAVVIAAVNPSFVSANTDYEGQIAKAFKTVCLANLKFENRVKEAKALGLSESTEKFAGIFAFDLRYEPDKKMHAVYEFDERGQYFVCILEGPANFSLLGRRSADCFVRVVFADHSVIREKLQDVMETSPDRVTNRPEVSTDIWHSLLSTEVTAFQSIPLDNGLKLVTLMTFHGSVKQ